LDLNLKVKCAGLFSLRSNQVLVLALVLGQKLRERLKPLHSIECAS